MKEKGFTLIELLVVIAIIGILSTIVLTSLTGARSRARDTQRIAQLNQIKTAIEAYELSHDGQAPRCAGAQYCTSTNPPPSGFGHMSALDIVASGNIPQLPNDPINQISQYGYYYARGFRPLSGGVAPAGCLVQTSAYCVVTTPDAANYYMIATRLENTSSNTQAAFSGWDNGQLNYVIGN